MEGGRISILTSAAPKRRFEWAKLHQNLTEEQWGHVSSHHYLFVRLLQVIFSDECSIEVQMAQPRVFRKGREPLSAAHLLNELSNLKKS